MTEPIEEARLFLFVPGNRPSLFDKADRGDADAVIIDLEDAVAEFDKDTARQVASEHRIFRKPCVIRVNAPGSEHFQKDIEALRDVEVAAIMVPKSEDPAAFKDIEHPVIALVESTLGVAYARELAAHNKVCRLAFGSIDYAADLGSSESREALLMARMELIFASRLAGCAAPIDGVTATFNDEAAVESDAAYAKSLGFSGKLLIHPAQIAPARRGFRPSEKEVAWAEKVLTALQGNEGDAIQVDGEMVDRPVILRAQQIFRDAK
ncbi:MAG: CoA ester lyase [Pseudomonadota bacterium]